MKLLFRAVIKWLSGLSWADFLRIVAAAQNIAERYPKKDSMFASERQLVNLQRATAARDWIVGAFPALSGWVLNVTLELAVAWLRKTES